MFGYWQDPENPSEPQKPINMTMNGIPVRSLRHAFEEAMKDSSGEYQILMLPSVYEEPILPSARRGTRSEPWAFWPPVSFEIQMKV